MKMIQMWFVVNTADNEYGHYTIWKEYEIVNWFITDDSWNQTNFWNVRKFFKKSIS